MKSMRAHVEVASVYGPDYGPDYSPPRRHTPPPSPLLMADPIEDMENFIGMFKARVDSVVRPARSICSSACYHWCPLGCHAAPRRGQTHIRLHPLMARLACAVH